MSDDLLLDIIARSIGRTITQENYRQRAADVLRSVKENDLTLPQPTNLIEHEITRLRAENERMREALKPLESELTELEKEIPEWVKKTKDSDLLGLTYVLTLGDLRRARTILEGATK